MNTMPVRAPTPLATLVMPLMLSLVACGPTGSNAASTPATPVNATTPTSPASTIDAPASTSRQPAAVGSPAEGSSAPASVASSISGAIRNGNRAPPALRVCATPVDGGVPTCIETPVGATSFRVDVAPGRYYLLGWAAAGELTLIAHASQIRCIQAPCPPDELIEVDVVAGQNREGVDLNGSYVDIPDGWPKRSG